MADFSNMKRLNPFITDFHILEVYLQQMFEMVLPNWVQESIDPRRKRNGKEAWKYKVEILEIANIRKD